MTAPSSHRFLFLSMVFAAAMMIAPVLRAQEAIPDVANGKRSLVARINANAVYIRSGPGDNYYPTMKLDTNAEVTVVGEKFDWLKIAPPEGSFSYVAKAFVDKNADSTGVVNRDEVNVRTGSSLNAMKTSIQAKLNKGDKVQIVDERDEYYTIKPPAGAYVYVNKQFAVRVREVAAQPEKKSDETAGAGAGAGTQTPDNAIAQANNGAGAEKTQEPAKFSDPKLGQPSTAPSEQVADANPPSTQPTAEVEFDKLEADFNDASKKTIEQQPIKEMLGRYQKLLADASLPESMKRVADFRIRTLTARGQAQEQFAEVQKMQAESAKRQQSLKAEQQELAEQIKKNDVALYAAVGTLRTSSLQNGTTTLYRLTDPQTGRTVVYIRTNDPKFGTLMGQFVGVKGEITNESQLSMKVVTPTAVEAVDQAAVLKSVAAQIVPPSILSQGATQASTGTN